jgi:hypothetical protein
MRLHLATTPQIELFDAQSERQYLETDLAFQTINEIGAIRIESGENPSTSINCSNSPRLVALLAQLALMSAPARLTHGARVLFAGAVSGLEITQEGITFNLEKSSASVPYTQKINLRETTVWGAYRAKEVIPLAYGRCAVKPLEYNVGRTLFVLADHAVQGVDAVYRNQQAALDYRHYNGADSSGRTVAFIELVKPLGDGEDLRVELRGKMSANGELIESAAGVLGDLLGGRWLGLPEYPVAGVITQQESLQSIVRAVVESVGWDWVPGSSTGLVERWAEPPSHTLPVLGEIANSAVVLVEDWRASLLPKPVGLVRATYAQDAEIGDARGAIELSVQGNDADTELVLELPWLVRARDALEVGLKAAQWLGRPGYSLNTTANLSARYSEIVLPGYWLDVQLSACPISGAAHVAAIEQDYDAGVQRITLMQPLGVTPQVSLVRVAEGYYPVVPANVAASHSNGTITLQLSDAAGAPLVAADVTLDGVVTRRTDNAGKVEFAAARGPHQLLIERAGFASQLAEIIV